MVYRENIIKYINFHNNSDLPIVIESWIDGSNILSSSKIEPHQCLVIHSSVGEWHLNSMFYDTDNRKLWKDKGLEKYLIIGKFRSSPCARGDYSWMEYDIFECKHIIQDKTPENNIKNLIIFSLKI